MQSKNIHQLFSDRADFIMFHLAKGVDELHRTDVQFFAAIESDHYDRQSLDFYQNDEKFKVCSI